MVNYAREIYVRFNLVNEVGLSINLGVRSPIGVMYVRELVSREAVSSVTEYET